MRSPQLLAADLRRIDNQILGIFTRQADTWEKTDPQLERIEEQLKAILREAQSQQNFAKMQKWNAAHGSTDRWNAQQKERESREVLEQALALKKDVEKLLGPNLMEVGKSLFENAEDWHKFQHEMHGVGAHVTHAGMHVPSYMPQTPQGANGVGGFSVVEPIVWVLAALQWWKRHQEKKARGAGWA